MEEHLPFALTSDERKPQHHVENAAQSTSRAPVVSIDYGHHSHLSSSSTHPPQLASSVISSPTDGESQASSVGEFGSSSLLQPDSQYLDAAASLLLPHGSVMGGSAATTQSAQSQAWQRESTTLSEAPSQSSVGFSQLLHQADNSLEKSNARLPVLPEENSVGSSDSPTSAFDHIPDASIALTPRPIENRTEGWFPRNLFMFQSQQTIIPASGQSLYQSEERRLASLAGATASLTGDSAFRVSVDLVATVGDVMEVIGNPDFLRLWCDPVTAILVTKSSEGAQTEQNRRDPPNREYDGAWVEATTPQLISPNNTSCVYRTTRTLSAAMGFPTYGKITMFVERTRGQVGLTIGPFVGGIEVSHKIKVEDVGGQKVRLIDQVRLQRDAGEEPVFCGIFDALEKCFLPTVDDYMDQVLSSMARLRFLVENGETSIYAEAAEEGSMSTPLLNQS